MSHNFFPLSIVWFFVKFFLLKCHLNVQFAFQKTLSLAMSIFFKHHLFDIHSPKRISLLFYYKIHWSRTIRFYLGTLGCKWCAYLLSFAFYTIFLATKIAYWKFFFTKTRIWIRLVIEILMEKSNTIKWRGIETVCSMWLLTEPSQCLINRSIFYGKIKCHTFTQFYALRFESATMVEVKRHSTFGSLAT